MKIIENSGVLIPHDPDCKCPSCWEDRYDSLERLFMLSRKLYEMALDLLCEEACPPTSGHCKETDNEVCKQCLHKYFKDKLKEGEND